MLVFFRKQGETIFINEAIEVSVLEIRGNRVRLGVTAPEGVAIHRFESPSCLASDCVTIRTTDELPEAK